MRGKREGPYLYVRHSADCKYYPEQSDRDESHRCNCVKYIGGSASGKRLRQSTGTSSWERARKALAHRITKQDSIHQTANPGTASASVPERQTMKEAVAQFLDAKRGENIVDMSHYVGFFEGELLPWCKQRGIHYVDELNLVLLIKFRNSLKNKGSVRNRKLARLRTFYSFCVDVGWSAANLAKKITPSQEDEADVDYFQPDEMNALENACYVALNWERGHDYEYRDKRLRAFLLFARWTGLAMIDCVRFERDRLQRRSDGIWQVMLRRQKNGNPVFVGVPPQAVEALTAIPPVSDRYFFWSGNGRPQTAVRGWRRSLGYVFKAAKLKRYGKPMRAHPHMLRHTFAVEKLLSGTSLEDVSLLLGHRSIKVTERHYLKFDQRRQERLIRASMTDWGQIEGPKPAKQKQRRKFVVMSRASDTKSKTLAR